MSHTRKDHVRALANYLPGGPLFSAKIRKDSNLYNFLYGIAKELKQASDYTEDYRNEILPDQTVEFIDEWEKAVGIPDGCFPGDGDIETRRTHVLVKLASLGVQTVQDFEDLGTLFGVNVTVYPAIEYKAKFPFTFPFVLNNDPIVLPYDRFRIIVEFSGLVGLEVFPMEFPLLFGTYEAGIVACLFRKLKPANCDMIFKIV